MNTEWNKVRAIFLQAIEFDDREQRDDYLDQACASNGPLRHRVDELLRGHGKSNPLVDLAATTLHYENESEPLDSIGHYQLLQQIGEGGFGVVYHAEQQHPLRRQVALKVLKPGMDTRQVIARFEAERQALALMDHPNIAQVYDAGQTPLGRPYFVMELVRGVPITNYCDEKRLNIRRRLELFVHVCQAVQHAHQKGIIHRDLKPSNILLATEDGQPLVKVIDFGIAKAIVQRLTDKTLVTESTQFVGTPAYMSPEQIRLGGIDVDTRTDVYSLGVLLYELLTGKMPFDLTSLRDVSLDEVRRIIQEQEPTKPSTRVSSLHEAAETIAAHRHCDVRQLRRQLRGDLDWIVLKALEKDRNRRYESPGAFAADIHHFLNNEPVNARPPALWYQMQKAARRHRVALGAGSLVAASLVVGTGLAVWQAVAATKAAAAEKKAKELALQREAEAKATIEFFENHILAATRPEGQEGGLGSDVTLRKVIEAALSQVNVSFKDQPYIEARLRLTMGLSFKYLGEYQVAANQFARAMSLIECLQGPSDAQYFQAKNNLANCLNNLGRNEEAHRHYKALFNERAQTLGSDHPVTLSCLANLAGSHFRQRQFKEAQALHERADKLLQIDPGPSHEYTLANLQGLANVQEAVGNHQDALKLRQAIVKRRTEFLSRDHPTMLGILGSLADSFSNVGRLAEALELYDEVLKVKQRKLPGDHPSVLVSMHNLATCYAKMERHAEAADLFEKTLAARRVKLGSDRIETRRTMFGLATCLLKLQRGAEAVKLLDECFHHGGGKDDGIVHDAILWRRWYFEANLDVQELQKTAEMWESLGRTDADGLAFASYLRAVVADVLLHLGNQDRADSEADRSMEFLRRAIQAGFKNRHYIDQRFQLEIMKQRPDFKSLVQSISSAAEHAKK